MSTLGWVVIKFHKAGSDQVICPDYRGYPHFRSEFILYSTVRDIIKCPKYKGVLIQGAWNREVHCNLFRGRTIYNIIITRSCMIIIIIDIIINDNL